MTGNLVFFLFKKAYPHQITQLLMHVFAWGLPTALSIYALAKRMYSTQFKVIVQMPRETLLDHFAIFFA